MHSQNAGISSVDTVKMLELLHAQSKCRNFWDFVEPDSDNAAI